MKLMDKINRSINKTGWEYQEWNGGDIKAIVARFSVTHNKTPLNGRITLSHGVSFPEYEISVYKNQDIKREYTLTWNSEGRSTDWGTIVDLFDNEIEGFDANEIEGLWKQLEKIEWSTKDLTESSDRRYNFMLSYVQYLKGE